jgi:hypothetical protein
MSTHPKELLFVQGVKKTGTSTIVGILNCHPEIFVLYETMLNNSMISKYGNQILSRYPEARQFFRSNKDFGVSYLEFLSFLEKKNPSYRYRYFGDKIISIDPDKIRTNCKFKIIFALRDIRTWLIKEQIQGDYRTDLDLVPATLDYLYYCIGSIRRPNSIRVRLENLVKHNQDEVNRIARFLNVDLSAYTDHWWKKIDVFQEEDPKSSIRWYDGHQSSRIKPAEMDSSVLLKPNPFWDTILNLFDKYYYCEDKSDFEEGEILHDIETLEEYRKFSPVRLEDAYFNISTTRLGVDRPQSWKHKLKGKIRKFWGDV